LGYGGEEASEGGAEIAGETKAPEVIGDVFAGLRSALQGIRSVLQGLV